MPIQPGDVIELTKIIDPDGVLEVPAGKWVVVRTFHEDSFEAGYPNWTDNMLRHFKHYRGYDIAPCMSYRMLVLPDDTRIPAAVAKKSPSWSRRGPPWRDHGQPPIPACSTIRIATRMCGRSRAWRWVSPVRTASWTVLKEFTADS